MVYNPLQHWWHMQKMVVIFSRLHFFSNLEPYKSHSEALEMTEFFTIWCFSCEKGPPALAHTTIMSTYLLWEHFPHWAMWRTPWRLRDRVFGRSLLSCKIHILSCPSRIFLQPPGISDTLYHSFQIHVKDLPPTTGDTCPKQTLWWYLNLWFKEVWIYKLVYYLTMPYLLLPIPRSSNSFTMRPLGT